MKNTEFLIRAENVSKTYISGDDPIAILSNLNLRVAPGETIAILGVSGTGKSTLLNILGGIDKATSGVLQIGNFNLTALTARDLTLFRREIVGFIFQFYNLIPSLTALENVLSALEAAGNHGQAGKDAARKILVKVGLGDKLDRFPEQLSGGEQQRVAIARALVKKPPLILADEPTGNLDPHTGENVLGILINQARETGAALIIVTHNPEVGQLTDRVLALRDGLLLDIGHATDS